MLNINSPQNGFSFSPSKIGNLQRSTEPRITHQRTTVHEEGSRKNYETSTETVNEHLRARRKRCG